MSIDELTTAFEAALDGYRFADARNWVDEGALSLGIASYAILDEKHTLRITRTEMHDRS